MLSPKRTKYRKMYKGRRTGVAQRGNEVAFGEFGLLALQDGYLTARQLEAARVAMSRSAKRGGNIWIRVFPDKPITRKPAETRMGKGKGAPEYWVCVIHPGRVLYEMGGVTEETAKEALHLAATKLPFKTKFIKKGDVL